MAEIEWSKEQQQVIWHRSSSMLVSAAAGSGKTAVLVERIVERLLEKEHPVDVDHLLVVTFTNAAAAEMRERIQKRLSELLENAKEEEVQERISRQLSLLNHAQISTIHSFCKSLVRNYFMEIGIEPSLRLADETELSLWKKDVMEALLEEEYEGIAENASFQNFVESFSTGKKDDGLSELLLKLYHMAVSFPYPEKWLEECAESISKDMEGSEWFAFIEKDIRESMKAIFEELSEAEELAWTDAGFLPYLETLQADREVLLGCQASSFEEMSERFAGLSFSKLKAVSRKAEVDEEVKKEIKAIRERVKKAVNDIRELYFFQSYEKMKEDLLESGNLIREMVRLTRKFMEKFQADKEERKVMDFNDLEHFALRILVKEENGVYERTLAARELQAYYEEIMIDEYQDSNQLQDVILSSIAREKDGEPVNLFMVGDVKQSIYRFRNAKPELFMQKYATYRDGLEKREQTELPVRIDLSRNYRSREEVIGAVNHIFEAVMQKRLGGIAYDEKAALYAGADYPPLKPFPVAECILVTEEEELEKDGTVGEEEEEGEKLDSQRELEARCIAKKIKEMIKNKVQVTENGALRDVRFGDIVILLRTMSGWSEEFKQILLEEGVPACADTQSGYFSAREVRLVLNLLRIIDNPRQDIPFAAVLYSSLAGFSKEELSDIRSTDRKDSLYQALVRFLELSGEEADATKKKIEAFLSMLSKFRAYASCHSVAQLLGFIFEQTGYYAYVRALPAGERRCANLDMLRRQAEHYGESHYQGLYHFLRYMDQLFRYEIDFGEADVPSAEADMVRIMSIHKSKGLEFPVVFAAGLGKHFNKTDLRQEVVADSGFGIACDVIDYEKRTKSVTLKKQAVKRKLWLDALSEELRVLYVALTRAKERLILTGYIGTAKRLEDEKNKAERRSEKELSYLSLTRAESFLDVVLPSICHHGETLVEISVTDQSELVNEKLDEQLLWAEKFALLTDFDGAAEEWCKKAEGELTSEQRKALEERDFSYDYSEAVGLKGKVTVSELKKRKWEEMEKLLSEEDREEGERLEEGQLKGEHWEEERLEEGKSEGEGLEEETPSRGTNMAQKAAGNEETPSRGTNMAPKTDINKERQLELEEEIPKPAFLREEEKVSGAHRGTVYHTIMEKLSFEQAVDKASLRAEIDRIFLENPMSEQEQKSVRVQDFYPIFTGENQGITDRLWRAEREKRLYREQPFVMGEPACQLYEASKSEEMILIQGIIDAYFEEDGALVLLDYKTDRVNQKTGEEELRRRYSEQLRLYGMALERATGKKVKEALIYSFCLGKYIAAGQTTSDR